MKFVYLFKVSGFQEDYRVRFVCPGGKLTNNYADEIKHITVLLLTNESFGSQINDHNH